MSEMSIRKKLVEVGSSMTEIAREQQVTIQTVSCVVNGRRRSRRVERAIAQKLGERVEQLWPERYRYLLSPSPCTTTPEESNHV